MEQLLSLIIFSFLAFNMYKSLKLRIEINYNMNLLNATKKSLFKGARIRYYNLGFTYLVVYSFYLIISELLGCDYYITELTILNLLLSLVIILFIQSNRNKLSRTNELLDKREIFHSRELEFSFLESKAIFYSEAENDYLSSLLRKKPICCLCFKTFFIGTILTETIIELTLLRHFNTSYHNLKLITS